MGAGHVHDWVGIQNLPDGPTHCQCGKSKWVAKGKPTRTMVTRFPQADAMERILALRAKLARGKEQFSAADMEELNLIAAELIRAFEPLQKALIAMGEQVITFLQAFMDRIDPAVVAQMAELAKAIGEKPDELPPNVVLVPAGSVYVRGVEQQIPVAHVAPGHLFDSGFGPARVARAMDEGRY